MNSIPEQWKDSALDFTLELMSETSNLPRYILNLLSKHFGFSRSMLVPRGFSRLGHGESALDNYITYGIPYGPMHDYKTHVYKIDPFKYSRLTPEQQKRSVLFLQDVMSMEGYEQTPFGKHMRTVDLYYQACLYLKKDGDVIASICLFRSETDSPFSEDERVLLEYLCGIISARYASYLQSTGNFLLHSGFDLFFKGAGTGAAILNQNLTVIKANPAAEELCRTFLSDFTVSGTNFLRGNYLEESKYLSVQTTVNEIGEALISKKGFMRFDSPAGAMSFSLSTFLSASESGILQTRYLALIAHQPRSRADSAAPLLLLTERESEVLRHVLGGKSNDEIAKTMFISAFTVRTHMTNIYKKFGVKNKVELILKLGSAQRD